MRGQRREGHTTHTRAAGQACYNHAVKNTTPSTPRGVLCWGRSDPGYSRNRILRQGYAALGWRVLDFQPRFSRWGDWEAVLRLRDRVDLVWVPCFRQRDIAAAARWARRRGVPLLFDPLISAYDKQVFERGKLDQHSAAARRLLQNERRQFALADAVLADTEAHAAFFREVLEVNAEKIHVVPVGAEENLFAPQAWPAGAEPMEVLFFGSFIPLQGPEVIVEAARLYRGPPLRWCLLGSGPLRAHCERAAQGLATVSFEDWLPYPQLPARIQRASIVLGIFGATPKAQRVIPNKVYQALACARPVVTLRSNAYPPALLTRENSGLHWVQADDAQALADAVAELAERRAALAEDGARARRSFDDYFSQDSINARLRQAIAAAMSTPARG